MGFQNGTPSKENTEEQEYTFYCEERLVRVLFFYFTVVKHGSLYKLGPVSGRQVLLYLWSFYQGGPETGPPLAVVKRDTGPILFIVLYSFIFHAKNHIYCMLAFFI